MESLEEQHRGDWTYLTDLQAFVRIAPDGKRLRPTTRQRVQVRQARQVHQDRQNAGAKSTQDTQATYHKVKKGETLSSIAHSYNTTVANLKKNNANASANLRAGEVLAHLASNRRGRLSTSYRTAFVSALPLSRMF